MIQPDKYDDRRANDLLWYLIDELRRCMADRGELESDWLRWERAYRARPVDAVKDFPFEGASNLVIPVTATDIDTLFARMMGLLLEPPNLWSVTGRRPEFQALAEACEDFLEWAQHHELEIHGPIGDWIVDIHKLGTGILKQRYTREMQKVYEWRELDDGSTFQQQAVVLLKDKPAIHRVQLHDFYIPAGFKSLPQAPWCAERIRLTWQQYMNRVKAGIYTGSDRIGAWFYSPPINQFQQQLDRMSRYYASQNKLMEFYEFWLDFDIDGDGWDEALLCTIHLDSQTYVRLDYNPFFNQEKPYSKAVFMRNVNSFYGTGLGEMLDHFQEEITAMHNQRIDNGTVGNSTMIAVRNDEKNVKIEEPIYPSKIWRLNDVNNIKTIAFGAPGTAASIEIEQTTRAESQRRTGVNDYIQAQSGPAQAYGPAYTTQQMILASSKRFGETLREVHSGLSETGTRILELYQQFNPRGKEFMALGQQEGTTVALLLRFPIDLIRRGLLVGVSAIDAETSREAQIRTTTLVMQQLMQFYSGYLNAMSYASNPQLPPQVRQAAMWSATGSAQLMEKLLHLSGEKNVEQLLPMIQGALNAQQQQLQQILFSAGAPVPAGSAGPAGQSAPGGPPMAGGPPASQGMAPVSPAPTGLPIFGGQPTGNGNGATPPLSFAR